MAFMIGSLHPTASLVKDKAIGWRQRFRSSLPVTDKMESFQQGFRTAKLVSHVRLVNESGLKTVLHETALIDVQYVPITKILAPVIKAKRTFFLASATRSGGAGQTP
jgi:hypothetical protein